MQQYGTYEARIGSISADEHSVVELGESVSAGAINVGDHVDASFSQFVRSGVRNVGVVGRVGRSGPSESVNKQQITLVM